MGNCCGREATATDQELPKQPRTRPTPAESRQTRSSRQRRSLDPAERYGVKSQFQAIKLAGKGAAGDVWVCRNLSNKDVVAIKFMKRPLSNNIVTMVTRELQIHALLGEGHVNIIKAYDAMLTNSHLGLIMEYAAGGNLTSYVAKKYEHSKATGLFLSEHEARFLFKQFVNAVNYCHKHCVAHRDLKLDNVLLDGSDPPVLKLTDFGFAKTWTGVGRNTAHIGTPVYMAPETIKNDKNVTFSPPSVDVWASGVLLLVMLLGAFPFDHTKNPDPNTFEAQYEVWQQEMTEKWYESPFLGDRPKRLSDSCRDLLNRIFNVDPISRITIPEIIEHPWYNLELPERYQAVLDRLAEEQSELDQWLASCKIDQSLVDEREQLLKLMVKEAGKKVADRSMGNVGALQIVDYQRQDIKHINLTHAAIEWFDSAGEPKAPMGPSASSEEAVVLERLQTFRKPEGNGSMKSITAGD